MCQNRHRYPRYALGTTFMIFLKNYTKGDISQNSADSLKWPIEAKNVKTKM